MRLFILAVLFCAPGFSASPATAYAISNITAASDWTGGSAANHWANACNGVAGSSGASGGGGVAIWGQTATLPAGVPGAAGLADSIVVCTGITVHVPVGIGIELNNGTDSATNGFRVQATDSVTFGRLIVDKGGLIKAHGLTVAGVNYGVVDQYADFHVMPGGSIWFGTGTVGGTQQLQVSGRAYFGCGDQAVPVLDCAGNAGGLVTASAGATLNFTGTLPYGLATGDLVELSRMQQPTSWGYPYTGIDGVTLPPAPPNMPTTSDTGAGKTCGTLATCLVPNDVLLCAIAVVGSSVTLGFPHGGNPWKPYCDGSETAIAIAIAGTGQLWLKMPPFVWNDPDLTTWNNSKTGVVTNANSQMDPIRTNYFFGLQPVSNAAGTGPGRPGDNSITWPTFTQPFSGVPSDTATSFEDVTAGKFFIDYNRGLISYGGWNSSGAWAASGDVLFKGASTGVFAEGRIAVPAGVRAYNELLFENIDIQGVIKNSARNEGFIAFSTLTNGTNNRMGFRHNTARMSADALGLYDFTASPSTPVEVTYNSFTDSNMQDVSIGQVGVFGSAKYWDLSNNFVWSSKGFFKCQYETTTTFIDIAFGTITNNDAVTDGMVGGDSNTGCQWRGTLIQDNRVTESGTQQAPGFGDYPGIPIGMLNNFNHPESPNRIRYNYTHGAFRGFGASQNQIWDHNYFTAMQHHGGFVNTPDGQNGGYISGLTVAFNILITQGTNCQDLGFANKLYIERLAWRNNTCIGPSTVNGGMYFGEASGGTVTSIVGASIYNNIFLPSGVGAGITKMNSDQNHMDSVALSYMGYNSTQGASATLYQGVGNGNPNNIPNPSYNRNAIVTQAGVNYNSSPTRNVTGVVIQNPSYATNQTTLALKETYTSASNRTLQLSSDNGATYGTAAQLNWGGSGTTYTVSSVTDPGVIHQYLSVVVTGTPFHLNPGGVTAFPTDNPATRWAVMLTGANAGTYYSIMPVEGTGATGAITFVPRITGIATDDTFAILNTEVRVFDAGGVNYVDVGILGRIEALPTSSKTDTGISIANTDYCSSGATPCLTGPIISSLPSTFTNGGPATPLYPIALPVAGGSAEQAFCIGQAACGATSYYRPSGSGAWVHGGEAGLYVGAVKPIANPPAPSEIQP